MNKLKDKQTVTMLLIAAALLIGASAGYFMGKSLSTTEIVVVEKIVEVEVPADTALTLTIPVQGSLLDAECLMGLYQDLWIFYSDSVGMSMVNYKVVLLHVDGTTTLVRTVVNGVPTDTQ